MIGKTEIRIHKLMQDTSLHAVKSLKYKESRVVMLQDLQILFWNIFSDLCQGKWDALLPDEIAVGSRLRFPSKVLGFHDEILALWKSVAR